MTDYGIDEPKCRAHRAGRVEYSIYFALIFMITLPFALLAVPVTFALHGRLPEQSPLARARSEAHAAATMIFRA
ncbi:cytochrome PufQ [Paracoccaceae bacterium Fryx2]|nr:cytochrome PufQ [Paracoccaceae bacterium Fryx2]